MEFTLTKQAAKVAHINLREARALIEKTPPQ